MVEKKSRDLSYEFIRVFSMFLIILDHELSTYTSPEASKIIEPIVAVGVTLFFLLSGRFAFKLNLEDKSLYKKFYWKKILGLIIPMLVYMLIKNYHVMVYNKGLEVHPMSFLTHFGVALVNGFSYMEYWFLYTLIALLIAVPFTARMVQNMQKKDKKAFLIVSLIFGTLSTYIPLVAKVDFSVAYYFIGYCLIFYAGAFIEEFFETKKSRAVLYCTAIPCVIVNTALAYFGYKSGYESTSPLFFVFTTAAFIALRELGKKLIKDPKKPFGKVIGFLGKHSLGVYMIHMIFVYHLNDMHIIPTNFIGLFISSIIITIVSVAAAFVLDSTIIKFLQKLTTKIFKLEKTLNAKIHRRILYSFLTGLFFCILFYFGTKLLFATFSDAEASYSILDYILLVPITLAATLAFYFLYGLKIKLKEDKVFSLKFWHIFIPLMASSIVIFLSIYPGHYPFDSAKMYEHFEDGSYTTHYSPLVSFVIGIFLSVGKFFGSKELGHAILIILQFIFLNIVITKTILHCSKKLNRKRFGIIFTIFFALHPLVQTLLIRSGQDTVFGGLFLMLCLEFLKISEDENYFKNKKKKKFFYIFFLIFFLCATRNNGIYVLIPAVITSIFVLKKETRKRFLIAVIAPVVAFLGYNYLFIYNIVSNRDSFFLETMNVPVMQIARSMYFNPDEELEEELKTYFDENCETWKMEKWDWRKYNLSEGISDPYKNCLKTAEIEKDPMKFFSLWQKIGSKNVKNYIEAPAVLTLGLYHPYLNYEPSWSTFQWHQYIDSYYENYDLYGINNTSILPSVRNMMSVLVYCQGWSRIPVLHLLWDAPFTVHLCLITLLITFYRRKHKYLLPLFLIFGLILTVALSPVMLFRYLFPAVIATPILIYILIRSLSSEK